MLLLRHLFFFFIIPIGLIAAPCDDIKNYIFEKLPEYGILKQAESGFTYVELPDDYIHKLALFLKEEGYEEPDYFKEGYHGAHISVIYTHEAKKYLFDEIEEIGSTIYFQIKRCQKIDPLKDGIEALYLVIVESPILDKIRKKYGLPKTKFDFHITIGVKPSKEKAA
jgi:hypothetical protein